MLRRSGPAAAIALLLAGLTLGCREDAPGAVMESGPEGKADGTGSETCSAGELRDLGRVRSRRASRLTGAVISWQRPGVVWAINDARLFAIDRSGAKLETYKVLENLELDWQALATDGASLYAVASTPEGPTIVRVVEPDPLTAAETSEFEVFEVASPSPDPIEAMFVADGSLFVLTRSTELTHLLSVPLPVTDGAAFEEIATSDTVDNLAGEVVGADATPDGRHIALKIRDEGILVWPRDPMRSVAETLAAVPCVSPGAPGRDRAVALEPGGRGYLLFPDDGGRARVVAVRDVPPSPAFGDVEQTGRLEAPSAVELSGIAASRSQPGVLWSHNDGGDGDERLALVAFDAQGTHFGDFAIVNATNEDWEDIAVAADADGNPMIYVADIGDNDLERESVRLVRVREPLVSSVPDGGRGTIEGHEEIELRYPAGRSHNAESMAIDPTTGDVLIITKRHRDDRKTRVYRARAPLTDDRTHVMEQIAIEGSGAPLDARFVAADISPDGRRLIAQVDDGDTLIWERHEGEDWASALLWPPTAQAAPEIQIEAVAFDEGGYVLVPEGTRPPIIRAEAR